MKKLSASTLVFLLIVLAFGFFSYASFGEKIVFMAAGTPERDAFFAFKGKQDHENRAKAAFPTEITFKFPSKFNVFYEDNFPFRSFLINKFQKLRKKIKDDPRVIVGFDNWMYSNSSPQAVYAKTGNILGDFTGKTLLNEKDEKLFTANMACQKKFFDANGIRFLVMAPPNKISVYPEHLPKAYRNQQAQKIRYEQVESILNGLGIEFVNVKKPILEAKSKGQVYFKTDTHWSQLGAYIGFRALTRRFGHEFPEMTGIKRHMLDCGDVYNMSVSLSGSCVDINDVPLLPEDTDGECVRSPRDQKIVCTNSRAPVDGKVLIVRDSMFSSLIDYTRRTFKNAVLLWRSMHTEQELLEEIKREKPTAVIYETGERYMMELQNAAMCPEAYVEIERLDQRAPAVPQKK
ncbi:MAG: hypothetical protein ACI4PW_02340 [Alphaproteobacteria bacterium]|jgi:alginate O-acetyltransferase complex protein AlgJ